MSRFKLLLVVVLLLVSSPARAGELRQATQPELPALQPSNNSQFHPAVQRFLSRANAVDGLQCGGVVYGGPAVERRADDWIEDVGGFVLRMSSAATEAEFRYIADLSRAILPAMVEVVGPPTAVETLTVELDDGPIQHYECGNHKIVMGTLNAEALATSWPGWDNLFIHELTHAFQKELLCGYPDYPSWLTEGMAEAARHFVSERATELAGGDRDFTRRRFDTRMAVYDLYNSPGEQVLGGRGAIAYRIAFDLLYQNAAGSMIVPIYAELGAGRADPHPLRRLTEALREEKNNVPVQMYEAMDRAWKTPIDGISPPSRWVRSRAVTCPSVRDGEFMLLLPPHPRNNVNPDGIVVIRFTRTGGAFQRFITTRNARFHGADGSLRSVPQQANWIVPPENLPQGAYLVEMDEPGMEGQTLSARTWILKVDPSFLGAFGEEALWDGIAVVFVDRNGRPVDVRDLSVDGRMIARVPGGVIARPHSDAGSLTFRGWGREIGTVSVPGELPRMVVMPVEPTSPNCVVSWTPYHPRAGESVEVFLRKDLSSIDPADENVWLVQYDLNRFVEIDRVAMEPTSDPNVLSATLPLPPLTDYGLLEFAGETSDHKGCLMSPCTWLTAYEFATRPPDMQEIIRLRRDGTDLVVDVQGDVDPARLLLRLSASPDGPWMNQPSARRDTRRPSALRWDISEKMNEGAYFEVARIVGNGDEVLTAGFLSSVPSLTTSVAYPVFPSPGAGPFRWQLDVAPPTKDDVTFRVYDVAGRLVHERSGRTLLPGLQEFWWDGQVDGQRAPSGVYFFKSVGSDIDLTGRVVIVR